MPTQISQIFLNLRLPRYIDEDLIIAPPMALAGIQPVVDYMLRLPYMFAEVAECPAGRAVATLMNSLSDVELAERERL